MTRKDWWLGVSLILLALAAGFGVVLWELSEIRADMAPGFRPLARH